MKKIILDLNASMSKKALHAYLKEKFGFPEYYGNNLDALYDCLTDISEPTAIGLFIADDFTDEADVITDNECFGSENGGTELPRPDGYLQKVRRVFADAERSNENLAVIFGR